MYLYGRLAIASNYKKNKLKGLIALFLSVFSAHLLLGVAPEDRGQTRSRRSISLLLQDQRSPNPQHPETHPPSRTVPGDAAKGNKLIQCVQSIIQYSAATFTVPNRAKSTE